MIRGGQGRGAREVEDAARFVAWAFVLGAICIAFAWWRGGAA